MDETRCKARTFRANDLFWTTTVVFRVLENWGYEEVQMMQL